MKLLQVTLLSQLNKNSAITDVAKILDGMEAHKIDIAPWQMYKYKPEVLFKMAYSKDCIFLKYFVTENEVRIVYQKSNDAVYKDSCVEFFISFEGKEYYNFEFNCIGTGLAAFGENREKRQFLPTSVIEKIKYNTSLHSTNVSAERIITWELTLIIPTDVFAYHNLSSLKDINCTGNFYKCGDDLAQQHYLAWNPIISPKPDFHLKEFFGAIKFI